MQFLRQQVDEFDLIVIVAILCATLPPLIEKGGIAGAMAGARFTIRLHPQLG